MTGDESTEIIHRWEQLDLYLKITISGSVALLGLLLAGFYGSLTSKWLSVIAAAGVLLYIIGLLFDHGSTKGRPEELLEKWSEDDE